jgi:hypothetical protein
MRLWFWRQPTTANSGLQSTIRFRFQGNVVKGNRIRKGLRRMGGGLMIPTAIRQQNMVMSPVGLGTKNYYADEDQQPFSSIKVGKTVGVYLIPCVCMYLHTCQRSSETEPRFIRIIVLFSCLNSQHLMQTMLSYSTAIYTQRNTRTVTITICSPEGSRSLKLYHFPCDSGKDGETFPVALVYGFWELDGLRADVWFALGRLNRGTNFKTERTSWQQDLHNHLIFLLSLPVSSTWVIFVLVKKGKVVPVLN